MFDINKPIEYVITKHPYAAKYLGTCNRDYRHMVLVEGICGGPDEVRFCNDKGEVDSPGKGCKVRNVQEKKKFWTVTYLDQRYSKDGQLGSYTTTNLQNKKVGDGLYGHQNIKVINIVEGEYVA